MFLRKGKMRTIIITWLVSYIIVLALPIIVNVLTTVHAKTTVKNEIYKANRYLLQRMQHSVESLFNEIERMSVDISLNAHVEELTKLTGEPDDAQQYLINYVTDDLMLKKISNNSDFDLYLYFVNIDTVVTSTIITDSMSFYSLLYEGTGMTYQQWQDALFRKTEDSYLNMQKLSDTGEIVDSITYIRHLPIMRRFLKEAVLVITVDHDKVFAGIKDEEAFDHDIALILDENNQILAINGSANHLDFFYDRQYPQTYSVERISFQGEKMIMSYISSDVNSWKYIYMVPEGIFLETVTFLQLTAFISILICILGGGILIFSFVRKNYKPLNGILETLSVKLGLTFDKSNNEFFFIQQAISNTLSDRENAYNIINQQTIQLKSNFLIQLLKGRAGSKVSVENHLKSFDIFFQSEDFVVMLFYLEYIDNTEINSEVIDFETELQSGYLIISNVMRDFVKKIGNSFFTEVDNIFACLINLKEDSTKMVGSVLNRMAHEAQIFISSNFDISFTVSLSNLHKTYAGISEAYREASQAMEFRLIKGAKEIIHYADINPTSTKSYYYSLEKEQELIDCVKFGHEANAQDIVNGIFAENEKVYLASVQLARCLMFDLVSTVMKITNELRKLYDTAFLERLSLIEKLLACETIEQMKLKMSKTIELLCKYVQEQREAARVDLFDEIEKYIKDNYKNPDLNISMLGEHFGMTPAYLAKLFKDKTGEKLLDFINKYRVTKAKLMLIRRRNLTIEEISVLSGYSNKRTFMRVFKQYEGITPGQYRGM